ncbi:MAG TPA: helix-turn-helix transcriptional regulator [Thermoanaerobaculia bacterium]|nr:helix-turn-helix transcriptional regulator [Thermoanaerobaculia bacterium]
MSESNRGPERIPQGILQKELGRRIVDLRKARRWKQGDLAKRLRVPRTRLGKWEQGLNAPPLEDLAMLAAVLEVTLGELVLSQAPPPPMLPPAERTELGMYIAGFIRLLKPLMERSQGKPGRSGGAT